MCIKFKQIIVAVLFCSVLLNVDFVFAVNADQTPVAGARAKSAHSGQENRYPGYTVDGQASPSVLAAQRSHTVEGQTETRFAIFTGLIVVAAVVLAVKLFSEKRF